MSTSELQGLQLPSFWNRNIDGIQALMDHTTFLAKIVQWLSFLFPGNSVCFLVCLSTTYLQTAMIWSHAVLLGLYHGLLGTFCSSLARPTTARKGGTTLGKRWAGTQMQGLRDWSHIPTVATKADSCVKQNQIKKKTSKAPAQNKATKEPVPISLYALLRPSPRIYFSKLPDVYCLSLTFISSAIFAASLEDFSTPFSCSLAFVQLKTHPKKSASWIYRHERHPLWHSKMMWAQA